MSAGKQKKGSGPSKRGRIVLSVALGGVLLVGAAILLILRRAPGGSDPTEGDGGFEYADCVDATGLDSVSVESERIDAAYADLIEEVRLFGASYSAAEPGYTAKRYDRATFSYSGAPVDGTVSDELLAALSGQTTAVIGSDTLYPAYDDPNDPALSTKGFEEQLIGLAVGQSADILVTFPADQSADGVDATPILGKRVRFTVEIIALERADLPDLSDSLIARYTGGEFQSVGAFREDAYARLRARFAYQALCDAVTVKSYPEELLNAESVRYVQNIILTQYDPDSLSDGRVREIYDELRDEAEEYARSAVADRLKAECVCDFAGVSFTNDEYAAALAADFAENAAGYSYLGITSESELEEYYGKDNLSAAYRVNKLMKSVEGLVAFR